MAKRLQNKVCIITGTGGSIGRAAALRFAEEGAFVVGCDTNAAAGQETVELVTSSGGKMISLHPADLTKMAGTRHTRIWKDGCTLQQCRNGSL
jgi:NAD(P)-dependent dehydrogenase (short-subunit alcohol dehydrogenase family)